MKTRKLTLCAFAAIAALATACSNDEPASTDAPKKGVVIEAIASTPQGGADTRLTHTDGTGKMNIVWAEGDEFTAFSSDGIANYVLQGEAGKASASFTGTWDTAPEEYEDFYCVYPTIESGDLSSIPFTLEGQDGTPAGLKNFNYMTAYSENASNPISLQFNHKVAIVKLKLTFPDGVTGSASNIGLKATGLYLSATYSLFAEQFDELVAGDVTTGANTLAIGSDGKLTAYLCLFSNYLTDVKALATVGNETYEADLSDLSLVDGNMYTAEVTLKNKKEVTPHIGDFYMSDGSIISQDVELTAKQKTECIGIVLKVGKDPHDDCNYVMKDGTTSMTDIKGYVLALNYANDGNYCIWGDTETEVGTGVPGGKTNSPFAFKGYEDTKKIKMRSDYSETSFPVAYHAINYESKHKAPANSSGWFLPSAGLLRIMLGNKDVILTSTKKVSGKTGWKNCWSSSENNKGSINCLYGNDPSNTQGKNATFLFVRSVLVF